MADDSQVFVIKTDKGDFRIIADAGMPTDKVLSLAAATNPDFALYHAQAQAHIAAIPRELSGVESELFKKHPANLFYRDIRERETPEQIAERQKIAGQVQHEVGVNAGMISGGALTGGLLEAPVGAGILARSALLLGRAGLSGIGQGIGALAGGGTEQEAKIAGATGAIAQPVAEGVSAVAQKIAPKLAETALNITDRMRGHGRTVGDAVLEYTTGIKPGTLAKDTKSAIGKLVGQMEGAVDQATQQGITGSAQPAHDVLNDAIQKLPRNARTIAEKFNGLHDLLDLGGGAQASYTPNDLLEMKRGIGKEMGTWPAEWQKVDDVKVLKTQLYGAIDSELDRLVPGNADLNQVISSLIPAKMQARRLSDASGIMQKIVHRAAAHTGALTAGVVGGDVGYRKGGIPGAIAGAAAGLAIPEAIASSSGQMAAARLINALGDKALDPTILPFIKALIASGGIKAGASIGEQLKSKGQEVPTQAGQ